MYRPRGPACTVCSETMQATGVPCQPAPGGSSIATRPAACWGGYSLVIGVISQPVDLWELIHWAVNTPHTSQWSEVL